MVCCEPDSKRPWIHLKIPFKTVFCWPIWVKNILKSNGSNNGKAMLPCPYQGIFTQSTKSTENVWEKLSKVSFRKMHATLFNCSKIYLFQCLTYQRQCKGQQKWFCKSYTSRTHSRRNLPNILTQMNNSYSQLIRNVRVKDRITNSRHFVVPITLCQ